MVAFFQQKAQTRTPHSATNETSDKKRDLRIVFTGDILVGSVGGLEGELVHAQILIEYPSSPMTVAVDDGARDDPNDLKGALFINGYLVVGTCVSDLSELAVISQVCQKSLELGFLFVSSHPLDQFDDDSPDFLRG